MRRHNGTPSAARPAGTPDRHDPAAAARPVVPPGIARRAAKRMASEIADEFQIEPLELRARAYHFEMIGAGCECFAAGAYPCNDCRNEAAELLKLLQSIVDETAAVQRRVLERGAQLPIGRRR